MYRCSACGYEAPNRWKLRRHLMKFVPCDFSCQYCSEAFDYNKAWRRHMQTSHPREWERREPSSWTEADEERLDDMRDTQAIIPIDPDLRRIPIEDYGWSVVMTTTDKICYTNGVYQVHRKQVIEKITLRDETIRSAFDIHSMAHAVKILVPQVDLDQIAMQIVMMHCNGTKPEFHSFFLSDMSRMSVKYYSRPDVESENCRWVTQPKKEAMNTINKHMRNLLPMLIEEGCAKLEPRLWNSESKGKHAVLALLGGSQKRFVVFFVDIWDDTLRYDYAYPEEVKECPESKFALDRVEELKKCIDIHKEQVLEVIKHYQMKDDTLSTFLGHTRGVVDTTI